MARHYCLSLAALSMLLCFSSTILAQSYDLTVRLVEFATPAPATQPAAQPPTGATDGNVGTVLAPSAMVTSGELPADAATVPELKLAVDLDRPFAAEMKERQVVWKVAGRLGPATAGEDAPLRLALALNYASAGGVQALNTVTIIMPGREIPLGGLTGQTGLYWTVRVTPKAGGK